MRQTVYLLLSIFIVSCSHFSRDEEMIILAATNTRLEIELGKKPASSKEEWLAKIQISRTSLKELERLLSDDWRIKYEKYGKADESDHKSAGCMHVYGDCKLKHDQETSWETLQFYFPTKDSR